MNSARTQIPPLKGVLTGSHEPVFGVLPQRILSDLTKLKSESSLLWNTIYARAQPALSLKKLMRLSPMWGSSLELAEDALIPYYWGYDQAGLRLKNLDKALMRVDGPDHQTEIDLFLVGERELILIEAKRAASLGRCGRHMAGRCPEIHRGGACRYWESDEARFAMALDFGPRPESDTASPPCNRHYQLARILLIGRALEESLGLRLHLWLIAPAGRWRALEPDWLDFCDRMRDDELWRRMRALSWEAIAGIAP